MQHRFGLTVAIFTVAAAVLTVGTPRAEAIGGEGETWPAFTESSSCGAQRVSTPHSSHSGWLGRSELLRGEFAAMFGRSVGAIHDDLVSWRIPGTTTHLAVHPWVVPALETAGRQLMAEQKNHRNYRIDGQTTYSTASRTIAGSIRISRHTYGTAFDINASKNPNRSDNRLITDIPEWWRQSFLDAGFCWGGLWIGSKDTMHFAWQGPAFSGYESLPLPYEPLTEPRRFSTPDRVLPVEIAEPPGTISTVLADITGNGAPDIVRITPSGSDLVLYGSVASRNHNACSARTSVVAGLADQARDALAVGFGDWDGRGGQDLWLLTNEYGRLGLRVRRAFGGFAAETTAVLNIPTPNSDAWFSTADADANGTLDLFIISGSTLTIWDVDPSTGKATVQRSVELPFDNSGRFTLGDFDLDNLPDLWMINDGQLSIALAADGYRRVSGTQELTGLPAHIATIRASDYDGDGRQDLIAIDDSSKLVWLGNTRMRDGLPLEVWFEDEEPDCADGEQSVVPLGELRFASSRWVAEGSYKWRRAHGMSVGCDPEDDECATAPSAHGMVAEFFAWIDGLEPSGGNPTAAAARALRGAGYPTSCPLTDEACWGEPMAAAELAARFGMFLTQRREIDLAEHRWVLPNPMNGPIHTASG